MTRIYLCSAPTYHRMTFHIMTHVYRVAYLFIRIGYTLIL